jgi:hypothetical protein
MQQAYSEFGGATNPDPAARPIAVRPPEANLSFGRLVNDGILSTPDVRCNARIAAGAVPRFSSNLSTFMSNCILVVTTLERNVSGRCRTTNPPTGARFGPIADTSPRGAFFIAVYADPGRDVCPVANSNVFFKYNLTVVKAAFLPVVECIRLTLNLI